MSKDASTSTAMSPAMEVATIAKLGAETRAALAQAESNAAEARKLTAEAETAEYDARMTAIVLAREEHKRRRELAADEHHLLYTFHGAVDRASAVKCIDQLSNWQRTRPGEAIEIQFNSPGGSVIDGFALWDSIQALKVAGHTVTTSSIGYAASMAGILLQAGDIRIMGRESWLMIHEASFGAQGKIGEVEDTVEWINMIQKRILNIFAERSNLSVRQLQNKWARKDWWISSEDALNLGLIDEIR